MISVGGSPQANTSRFLPPSPPFPVVIGRVQISRSRLFLVDVVDIDSNVAAIEQTRDVIDESTLDPEPFGFSEMFIITEQFLVIYDELILNFILALVAVAVLSLFILGDMAMVALICLTVVRRFSFLHFRFVYFTYCIRSYFMSRNTSSSKRKCCTLPLSTPTNPLFFFS